MPTDHEIASHWKGLLKTRDGLLANARQHNDLVHNALSHALVLKRKTQVHFAERVIARHSGSVDPEAVAYVAGIPLAFARDVALALAPAMRKSHITTPERAAQFIAQVCHESVAFHYTEEIASGSAYEGRRDLGNTHPGDGVRFKGRTWIQITGRSNYAAVSRAIGVDFVAHPTLLATTKYAAYGAAWWWDTHGCNQLADSNHGSILATTHRVNGGENGLSSREAYYARARHVASKLVP